MNHLDVNYRALLGYRALTRENRDCTALRRTLAQTDPQNDKIVVTRHTCTVDEDWIIAIEKGLIYIEKAIKEERQFIYSQGEVEPIEKVKHIARESITHLAKHSNLITKEQEGDEIIPDQLYNVERLNDYAVYENRFLYMLLCYLRDFVTIRYNKILDLTNKYDGVLTIKKEIALPNRMISYSVDIHDVRKDDAYLKDHNPARDVIDRIDLILKTILAFLATPLMEIAGKAAKLKPPITKTNVLKMDNNFKGAVALYDFIVAYDKPGFVSQELTNEFAPFGDILGDEVAEAGSLLLFLMYEYGLGINDELKQSYLEEEARRKTEEIRRREEQIASMKRRLANMEISPEEYILELEKQIKLLEADNRNLEPLRIKVKELEETVRDLNLEIERLNFKIDALVEELEATKIYYENLIAEIRAAYEAEIARLKAEYEAEIARLKAEYEAEIARLKEEHEAEIARLKAEHDAEIEALNAAHAEEIDALNAAHADEIRVLNENHAEEIKAINEAHEAKLLEINESHAKEIEEINSNWQILVDDLNAQIENAEAEHKARIDAIKADMDALKNDYDGQIAKLNDQMKSKENEFNSALDTANGKIEKGITAFNTLKAEYDSLLDEKHMCDARIRALKIKLGVITPDATYTEKEHFDGLETEFNAFNKFYKKCWNNAKKEIRKDMLNYKTLIGFDLHKKKL